MKILDIRQDEYGKVLFCGLLLAVRTCGNVVGWSAVQSILLKRWGLENLAYSFIFFALAGMVGSFLYITLADALRRETLLKSYCAFTGIAMLLAVFFLPEGHAGVTAELVLFSVLILTAYGLGYSTLGIQIWTIINDVFHPSQGIRIYPIIATTPLIGGIVGGIILQFMSHWFSSSILIIFWAISVLATVPIVRLFEQFYGHETAKPIMESSGHGFKWASLTTNFKQGAAYFMQSHFLHALGGICILFWAVASLKEFQYGSIINASFPTEDTLNWYYGIYNIVLNTFVLVFQLSMTGRIIKNIGVGIALCILPITIFAGLNILWFFYTFWAAFLMRFTWDIVAMTLQGSAFQLSFNAVPSPYRGRIRGLLEGVINPLGGILGGCLLILVKNRYGGTSLESRSGHLMWIMILALLLALFWICIALHARRRYISKILQNLSSTDPRTYQDALEMSGELKGHFIKPRFFLRVNIFNGRGILLLSRSETTGGHQVEVKLEDIVWHTHYEDENLVTTRRRGIQEQVSRNRPGLIYWENKWGYLAIFWQEQYISKVEIGNYSKREVEVVHCRSEHFTIPQKITDQGPSADPFFRLAVDITPSGEAIL